jgi:two-component system, LytTR family, sensor kinase
VREDEPAPSRKGIGLNNVRARLETLYGAAASLELTRAAGQGTRVSVRLPLRRTGAAT